MNATPMSIQPAPAIQAQPSSGKQDSAAAEVPFSQVLSSEIAQNRNSTPGDGNADADSKAGTEIASALAKPTEAETGAEAAEDLFAHLGLEGTQGSGLDAAATPGEGLLALLEPVAAQASSQVIAAAPGENLLALQEPVAAQESSQATAAIPSEDPLARLEPVVVQNNSSQAAAATPSENLPARQEPVAAQDSSQPAAATAAAPGGDPLARLEYESAQTAAATPSEDLPARPETEGISEQAVAVATGAVPLAIVEPEAAQDIEQAAVAAPGADPLAPPLNTGAEALIATVISPDQQRPAPAESGDADADERVASTLTFQGARKGRAPLTEQAGQFSDSEHGAQKDTPALADKARAHAASTTAAANAFAGRLAAAAWQPETTKAVEFTTDLMSHPAMRAASHVPLESLPAASEVASAKLAPPLGTTAWNQALGDKLIWMATAAQQTATLTLNPPNMGPLQVVLNVSNEQATASFFSAQPEVRQALESAFPRLKEMMNEAGIQLGQATVSADTPRQNDTPDRQGQRVASFSTQANETVTSGQLGIQSPTPHARRGLIDTFA